MKRVFLLVLAAMLVVLGFVLFWRREGNPGRAGMVPVPTMSQPPVVAIRSTASEALLEGYGDENAPPVEDLRKIHRVVAGYFSVIKDPSRFPLGGNADLSAALRGENPNREIFVRRDHPIFSGDGLLVDRWGTPLAVHPEGWRQIGVRSAGPDRKAYTADDLVILPTGLQAPP